MTEPGAPPRSRDDDWAATPRRRDWRWWVGGIGRVLVAMGVLLLGFVAFQLWGTGVQEARAQQALEDEFAAAVAQFPTPTTAASTSGPTVVPPTSSPGTTVPATTTTAPPVALPTLSPGGAVARIEIPKIGVDKIVVAGTGKEDLKKGPGHYPGTPFPGEVGNVAIAGHRTTYGAPFYRINELQPGDEIILTSFLGRYVYTVTNQLIVNPTDTWVVAPSDEAVLTLTSCHPRYSAKQRIVIQAELDESQTPAFQGDVTGGYPSLVPPPAALPEVLPDEETTVPATLPPVATTAGAVGASTLPGSGPGGDAVAATTVPTATSVPTVITGGTVVAVDAELTGLGLEDGFEQGWASDPAGWWGVLWWGLALTAVAIGAWVLGKRVHKQWLVGPLALIPFLACLWFFYESVSLLLPPGY